MTDSLSAAEKRSLRAQLNALERKQDARFARRETFLNERDRALAGRASELEATIKDYQKQLAAAQAELAKLDDTEVPAEPAGSQQLGQEAEAAQVAAAGIYSREFAEWRAEHVAPASRGLFQQ